ncbi:MAG: hypothetical protein ACNA8R_05995 [Nitriliruptoraceae bacterium]
MRQSLVTATYLLGICVIPSLALLAAVLIPEGRIDGLVEPPRRDLTVPLDAVAVTDQRSLTLNLDWSPPEKAVAHAEAPGIVTRVEVRGGESIATGDLLYEIDGVAVVGLASAEPLIADVTADSRPVDLEAVSELLIAVGVLDEGYDIASGWTSELSAGIRRYRESLGESSQDVFERRFVIWLPRDPFVVDEVTLSAGDLTPPPGDTVLIARPMLAVAQPAGEDEATTDFGFLPGSYELSFEGDQLGVWQPGDDLSPDVVEQLGLQIEADSEFAIVQTSLSNPIRVVALPASAVTEDAEGRTCAWKPGDPPEPILIEVLRGSDGRVEIAMPTLEGEVLAVAGRMVRPGEPCQP